MWGFGRLEIPVSFLVKLTQRSTGATFENGRKAEFTGNSTPNIVWLPPSLYATFAYSYASIPDTPFPLNLSPIPIENTSYIHPPSNLTLLQSPFIPDSSNLRSSEQGQHRVCFSWGARSNEEKKERERESEIEEKSEGSAMRIKQIGKMYFYEKHIEFPPTFQTSPHLDAAGGCFTLRLPFHFMTSDTLFSILLQITKIHFYLTIYDGKLEKKILVNLKRITFLLTHIYFDKWKLFLS